MASQRTKNRPDYKALSQGARIPPQRTRKRAISTVSTASQAQKAKRASTAPPTAYDDEMTEEEEDETTTGLPPLSQPTQRLQATTALTETYISSSPPSTPAISTFSSDNGLEDEEEVEITRAIQQDQTPITVIIKAVLATKARPFHEDSETLPFSKLLATKLHDWEHNANLAYRPSEHIIEAQSLLFRVAKLPITLAWSSRFLDDDSGFEKVRKALLDKTICKGLNPDLHITITYLRHLETTHNEVGVSRTTTIPSSTVEPLQRACFQFNACHGRDVFFCDSQDLYPGQFSRQIVQAFIDKATAKAEIQKRKLHLGDTTCRIGSRSISYDFQSEEMDERIKDTVALHLQLLKDKTQAIIHVETAFVADGFPSRSDIQTPKSQKATNETSINKIATTIDLTAEKDRANSYAALTDRWGCCIPTCLNNDKKTSISMCYWHEKDEPKGHFLLDSTDIQIWARDIDRGLATIDTPTDQLKLSLRRKPSGATKCDKSKKKTPEDKSQPPPPPQPLYGQWPPYPVPQYGSLLYPPQYPPLQYSPYQPILPPQPLQPTSSPPRPPSRSVYSPYEEIEVFFEWWLKREPSDPQLRATRDTCLHESLNLQTLTKLTFQQWKDFEMALGHFFSIKPAIKSFYVECRKKANNDSNEEEKE